MPDDTETREDAPGKRPYEAPALTVLGTVEDLTRSVPGSLTP
jgi:hypothetical protein